MSEGYRVDIEVLDLAGEAIAQTMHDMESCEVQGICGEQAQYGHAGLHEAFGHFCERWQEGVEMLIEDGDTIVRVLNRAAQAYLQADHDSIRTLESAGAGLDPAAGAIDG